MNPIPWIICIIFAILVLMGIKDKMWNMNVDLEQAKVLKGGGFPQGELKDKEGKRV